MNSLNYISCKAIFKICLTLVLSLGFCQVSAQQNTDYAVHANIIYRITKYIDWPGGKTQSGDFVIGIVGESTLFDELKKLVAGKKVGNQKIVVTKLSASASSFSCQVLFVPEEENNHFKKILGKTYNSGTLVISESEGLAGEGSCINFVIVDDHLKLEINKKNIEKRDLKIASELLQLGIPVK